VKAARCIPTPHFLIDSNVFDRKKVLNCMTDDNGDNNNNNEGKEVGEGGEGPKRAKMGKRAVKAARCVPAPHFFY